MTRLIIAMSETPGVIRESVRCCLKAHGIDLAEHILHEVGNNATQALFSIDETPFDSTEPVTENACGSPPSLAGVTAPASSSCPEVDALDSTDSDAPRAP